MNWNAITSKDKRNKEVKSSFTSIYGMYYVSVALGTGDTN